MNKIKSIKKIYFTLIFFMLFAGTITTQLFFDAQKARQKYVEPMVFRPDLVKAIDLGLHNTAADLEWLGAIQYFGGGQSKDYSRLPEYLNFTTDIDPKFSYPYAFGALVLPSFGYVDEGLNLAQKGIDNDVPDWRIPYYMATTYYINKKDDANAAKYFDLAANTPGVPDGIKMVVANFGSRKDKVEQTIQIWAGIYGTTKDEVVKERAKNYILHLELIKFLNEAIDQYTKINHKKPVEINDLVTGKILKEIPQDPLGFQFSINSDGTAVQTK